LLDLRTFVHVECTSHFDVVCLSTHSINKPGGCAKVTKVHYTIDGLTVESIDVKYVLGGGNEKEIDPAIVSPFETLERGGRKRRGREFLMDKADKVVKKVKQAIRKNAPPKNANNASSTTAGQRSLQAKKTAEPDQSTTPSTPITPEHPCAPSKAAAKSSKTGAASVPSFVIADRAVEVSPLPMDRAVAEPMQSTVARRGLFGCSGSQKSKKSKDHQSDRKVAAKPKPSIVAKKAMTTDDTTSDDDAFHNAVKDVTKAHSAAMKDSMTMKQARNVSNKFGGTKKMPLADRKPAAKPLNNNISSAGAATEARKVGTSTKTSLKNVFDYELRKAKQFLDEVCRAPCNDEAEVIDPASKENRLNTSGSEGEEDSKPAT
jgi:hypothetical protein